MATVRDQAVTSAARAVSLRETLRGASLLGFDTTGWGAESSETGAKSAFVGLASGPSFQMQYQYILTPTGNNNEYTLSAPASLNLTLSDVQISTPDNLTIIGDKSSDEFADGNRLFVYVAKTADQSGIAGRYNGNTYFFSDQLYTSGDTISLDTTPYVVCYASGTRILTGRGPIAVEDLSVGDIAVTASGEERPIRWIGHRTLACEGRADILPVRIAAHAFGEGRPARDLRVSPAHAIAVDILGEVLVPAGRLINGSTITRDEVERVTYWHVELDSHDLLVAEGLAAESYLDAGNRGFFAESGVIELNGAPDARHDGAHGFCRPLHEDGPLVEMLRARLEERAKSLGWRLVETPMSDLHLIADGRVIRPEIEGLTARFVLSADTGDVRLVSGVGVPAHVSTTSSDDRRLGVSVAALVIDDGLTGARTIALDDPRLVQGFHPVDGEDGARWRWTDGAAVLPSSLWEGCRGAFFLLVVSAGLTMPRWLGPGAAEGVVPDDASRAG